MVGWVGEQGTGQQHQGTPAPLPVTMGARVFLDISCKIQYSSYLRRLVFTSRLCETVLGWQCWHRPHCHTLGTTLAPFPRALWGWAEASLTAVAAKGLMDGQGTRSCLMESWHLLYYMVTTASCTGGEDRYDRLHPWGQCQTVVAPASP